MDKKEVIKFMRTWAYLSIFSAPFTSQGSKYGGMMMSFASLAFLHWTDDISQSK